MRDISQRFKRALMAGLLASGVVFTYLFLGVIKVDIVYTHLFYIPIILSAIWWRWPAILVAIFLASQLIIIRSLVDQRSGWPIHDIFRALMFLIISVFVIRLSELIKKNQDALRRTILESEVNIKERTAELSKKNELLSSEVAIRKKSEQSARVFRQVAERSDQGFGMADLKGNIIYLNRALSKIFGEESIDAAVNKSIFDYYPKEAHKRIQEAVLPSVLEGDSWKGQSEIISRKGKAINVIENIFIINDDLGRPQFFADIITDITDIKKIQDDLKDKVRDLEEFGKIVVDREIRMEGLENKIRELEDRLKSAI